MVNPFAFRPLQVTTLLTAVYVAIFSALLVVHHRLSDVPSAAEIDRDWTGVAVSDGWADLKVISNSLHPFNSHANARLRTWLAGRIRQELDHNGVDWVEEVSLTGDSGASTQSGSYISQKSYGAVFLNDLQSNITFPDDRLYVVYHELDNLLVYIRGSADPEGQFWRSDGPAAGLVLVSAHFDSVSTGYGATDDGKGVVSVLQVIKHFTASGQQPKHGIVAFINQNEEDGLFGAAAYTKHPIARHTTTFLNLEGAGAGGRATLFRATDAGVTRAYAHSKHPYGTVLSADGFKSGFVRSGTDYSNYVDILGMRGLDVAFFGPRSKYHTNRDDARDTSRTSLWHMLGAALATTKTLTNGEYDKDAGDTGVWFDLLGRVFMVSNLTTFFALDITLLVAGPILLAVLQIPLSKADKWYPFSSKTFVHGHDDDEPVQLYGMRGFFRFPFVFVISSAAVIALSLLVTKINPYILYSSPYPIWTMLISIFVSVSWFLLCLGDAVRPSALSRLYTLLWLYILSWLSLVLSAIVADRFDIAGSYFLTLFNASVLVSLLISYIELFALPEKSQYARHLMGVTSSRRPSHQPSSRPTSSRAANEAEEPDERTTLLSPSTSTQRPSMNNYRRHTNDGASNTASEEAEDSFPDLHVSKPHENEQAWSGPLPSWTWILQALILIPFNLMIFGQIALFLTSALHQTPADGNEVLPIYIFFSALTILLVLPATPFLHRLTWHIPVLLFLICAGTTAFNLLGQPFTADDRLKVFFVQRLNVDTGGNEVALSGVNGYVEKIVAELPSFEGKHFECGPDGAGRPWARRRELWTCVFEGLEPNVLHGYDPIPSSNVSLSPRTIKPPAPHFELQKKTGHKQPTIKNWISVSSHRLYSNHTSPGSKRSTSLITLSGLNTRSCRLYFHPSPSQSITDVRTLNACPHLKTNETECDEGRQRAMPTYPLNQKANEQIRLFSREFGATFRVIVDWTTEVKDRGKEGLKAEEGKDRRDKLKGEAVGVWSDANEKGTIPALDEMLQFAPVWAAITKHSDGLVEGVREIEL